MDLVLQKVPFRGFTEVFEEFHRRLRLLQEVVAGPSVRSAE